MANKLSIIIDTLYKGQGAKQATKDLEGLGKAAQGGTSKMEMIRGAMGKVALAAGAVGTAVYAAKKVFDFGAEGQQIQNIRASFEQLAESVGENAAGMMSAMRTATGNMVSDSELALAGSRFLSMGLAESTEETSKLAEMAVVLGQAMGKDASAAMEEFSLLLANQSIPRLDTFGISAGAVRTRIAELQAETPELTREMAFMQAVMEEGADSMERLGGELKSDAFKEAAIELANLNDELKILVSMGLGPELKKITSGLRLERTTRDFAELAKGAGWSRNEIQKFVTALTGFNVTAEDAEHDTELFAIAMEVLAENAEILPQELLNIAKYSDWVADSQRRGASAIQENTYQMTTQRREMDYWARSHAYVGEAISELDRATGVAASSMMDSWQRASDDLVIKAGEIQRGLGLAGDAIREFGEIGQWMGNNALGLLNEELSELGPQMVYFGGRTADQNRILDEAARRYDNLEDEIVDVTIGLDSLNMTSEEQAERIAEIREEQGKLIPLMDNLNSVQASGRFVVRQATINQEALNEAFIKGLPLTDDNAEAYLGLATSLGVFNEEQAEAIWLQIQMEMGIEDIREALANGTITIGQAEDALYTLGQEGYESLQKVLDQTAKILSDLEKLRDGSWRFDVELVQTVTQLSQPGPTQGATGQTSTTGLTGEFGQHGLDMTVPPGYPNDSFPIWTTSGEHVQVTPAGRTPSGGSTIINIDARGAAPGVEQAIVAGMLKAGMTADRIKRTR